MGCLLGSIKGLLEVPGPEFKVDAVGFSQAPFSFMGAGVE